MNTDRIELKRLRREEVLAVQASMAEVGQACDFLDSQVEHLLVLTRLTVEFAHYLEGPDSSSFDDPEMELTYANHSTFASVESFMLMSQAYRMLPEPKESTLVWGDASIESLKKVFSAKYREFRAEVNPEHRCRLLLDLFKLQIVFAGVSYC
jgi:hypothetical protein